MNTLELCDSYSTAMLIFNHSTVTALHSDPILNNMMIHFDCDIDRMEVCLILGKEEKYNTVKSSC